MNMNQNDEAERFAMSKRQLANAREQGGTPISQLQPLSVRLLGEFEQFAGDRLLTEKRWLSDLRQYLGIYEPDVLKRLKNRSKAFKRKTRAKVRAVDSRMFDLLFPANAERNYRLGATPDPTISDEDRQRIIATLKDASESKLREAIREFVDKAAIRMSDTCDDQLIEARYRKIARQVLHSGNLYGTGILKGPLVERRMSKVRYIYSASEKKFVLSRQEDFRPFIDFVPLWRFFPDMAVTELQHARACWERHLMSQRAMYGLAKSNKTVDGERIRQYVASLPSGYVKRRWFEQQLQVMGTNRNTNFAMAGQYEILERWGWLTRDDLQAVGVKLPTSDDDIYFGNMLILPNGEPIKAVLQPMEGQEWPYHLYYFDKDETNIFGEGLATVMRGDQQMLNSATRAIYDNAAVTAGPQLEVFTDLLAKGERIDQIRPFRIWARTKGDPQYPAIRAVNIDSHLGELKTIADDADSSADETTSIPKFMYGENATKGAAGTSSGMSMLLGQANIALKDQVSAWDEGITKPFMTGMYAWNMQFNPDNAIKGDFDVQALGAASLVAKEVRSQQMATYASTMAEEERQYIKWDEFARQRAQANEMLGIVMSKEEVEEKSNSEEAKLQDQIVKKQQELQLASLAANVSKLEAQVAQITADTINKRVTAAFAAMQGGGVAAMNPAAAAGGDEILKSAGWNDHTPQSTTTTAVEQGPAAPAAQPSPAIQGMPDSQSIDQGAEATDPNNAMPVPDLDRGGAHVGQLAGMTTPQIPG